MPRRDGVQVQTCVRVDDMLAADFDRPVPGSADLTVLRSDCTLGVSDIVWMWAKSTTVSCAGWLKVVNGQDAVKLERLSAEGAFGFLGDPGGDAGPVEAVAALGDGARTAVRRALIHAQRTLQRRTRIARRRRRIHFRHHIPIPTTVLTVLVVVIVGKVRVEQRYDALALAPVRLRE